MLPNAKNGHTQGVTDGEEPELLLFDPRRTDAFTNPYRMFQRLRAHDPIHYRSAHDDWVLTRYADVAAVLSDNRFGFGEIAGSQPASVSQEQANFDQLRRALQQIHRQVQYLSGLWLGERNPPEHTRMRRQLQRALAPYATEQFRRRIQAITNSVLNRLPGAGSLDAVADLASLVPAAVMAEILGVPSQGYAYLQRWSSRLACMVDLDISTVAKEQGRVALLGLIEYSRTLLAERRQCPGPDLMSELIRDQEQGHLSPDEVLITCAILLFAGYETTRHLIAMSLFSLLQHPDQLLHLQREPTLIAQAVEECLRYDGPAQHVRRMALTDVNLGGRTIRRRQTVHLLLGAANRDPARFSEPDRLDITRRSRGHLGFGHGIHTCLGASLARTEVQVAVGTLLRRLPELTLGKTAPVWEERFTIRGLKSLPLTF